MPGSSHRTPLDGGGGMTWHLLGADPSGGGPADRPPLLLLHPWFGCWQMWEPLAARWDMPVHAVDWYSVAAGRSAEEWSKWASPDGLLRAVTALLDDQQLSQVDVVGNSVGGIVAQLLAIEQPERVHRLVLIGAGAALHGPPTPFGTLVDRWITRPDERHDLARELVDALVARPHPPDARRRYLAAVEAADPDFISAVLVAARQVDLRPRLAAITAPTLVIRGEHDTARSRAHVADLVSGIRDVRAIELAGLGHSPMVEDPACVAARIREHLLP